METYPQINNLNFQHIHILKKIKMKNPKAQINYHPLMRTINTCE